MEYVNADTIAQGLSAFAPETAAIEAGRVMLHRLNVLAEQNKDFAVEATLASRFYSKWLARLQTKGYHIHLVFLRLNSPELAIQRVAERVRTGGHNIPEDTIRRRYDRGYANFFKLYRPFIDSWQVYDVSEEFTIEVAFGDKLDGQIIIKHSLWQMIEK